MAGFLHYPSAKCTWFRIFREERYRWKKWTLFWIAEAVFFQEKDSRFNLRI